MSSYFDGSTLLISARSPFARRVRVAFQEHGVSYQEKVFDVFQPSAELWNVNPLARVPALVFKTGESIVDSNLILQAFYENGSSPFMPQDRAKRWEVLRYSGIAVGLFEKTIEYFLEGLRPADRRDSELIAEVESACVRTLSSFEKVLKGKDFLVENGGQPTQADFDFAIALDYLTLRHPLSWKEKYPHCRAHWERLSSRNSFKKTVPPPPA